MVTDPVAFHPDFKARLYSDGSGLNTDEFYVDDFMVGCGDTTDSDLDGTIDVFDCDVYDPAHWSDCGLCVDGDGDGFGSACDLGDDCDDLDAAVNPLGVDLGINGADEDCDGLDGAPLLVEDFETGSVNPLVWSTINGDGGIVSTESYAGVYSLDLGGGGAQALTVLVDTTMCVTVGYRYWGKQGPEQPDSTDTLDVSYDYGAGLRVQESWPGGDTSGVWQYRTGQIPDPLAVSAAFQLEFYALGTGSGFDDYYIDDFALGCAP